mgnify:CR=1 FL=1
MTIQIRDAKPTDAAQIADFNTKMAQETESKTLDPNLIGPGVEAVLSDREKGRYWVADIDGEAAGQLLVTYEWSDWRNGMIWWIQSVYVPEKFRRKGVFSALYKHVESLAKADASVCGIRLYVERGNEKAQATYLNLGMVDPGYRMMESIFR